MQPFLYVLSWALGGGVIGFTLGAIEGWNRKAVKYVVYLLFAYAVLSMVRVVPRFVDLDPTIPVFAVFTLILWKSWDVGKEAVEGNGGEKNE